MEFFISRVRETWYYDIVFATCGSSGIVISPYVSLQLLCSYSNLLISKAGEGTQAVQNNSAKASFFFQCILPISVSFSNLFIFSLL